MRLPDKVATIVIGNPSIADASLQGGGVLVVTGKGYGSTNLLAMDRNGKIVMDTTVQVVGPAGADLIVVYKGTAANPTAARRNARRASRSATRTSIFLKRLRRAAPAPPRHSRLRSKRGLTRLASA